MMETAIAALMFLMGIGIAGVWTRDILAGTHVDVSGGILAARDPESGSLLWPHWLAEYGTAILLVVSAIGLVTDMPWGRTLTGIASGALLYTSTNSLGWSLARPERRPYVAPMILGVIVAAATGAYLLIS